MRIKACGQTLAPVRIAHSPVNPAVAITVAALIGLEAWQHKGYVSIRDSAARCVSHELYATCK